MRTRLTTAALLFAPLGCNAILGTTDPSPRSDASTDAATDAELADDASLTEGAPEGGTYCDGVLVDLTTNREHCGVCDRVCRDGSTCSSGECDPVLLAGSPASYRGLSELYDMVALARPTPTMPNPDPIGGDNVIFGTNWYQAQSLVYSTPTAPPVANAPAPLFPTAGTVADGAANVIATDGAMLYFGISRPDNGWRAGVWSLDFDGNGRYFVGGQGVKALAVDDSYVYWLDDAPGLHVADKNGAQVANVAAGSTINAVVAKNGRVVFDRDGVLVAGTRPAAADAATLSDDVIAHAFAVDDAGGSSGDVSSVYWLGASATPGVPRVLRRPVDASGQAVDLTPPGFPPLLNGSAKLLVDDRYVYMASNDDLVGPLSGILARVPKDAPGASTEIMVRLTGNSFSGMAQDRSFVFYGTKGNVTSAPYSAIWKVPK
jgi:hypothetical protein